MYLSLYPQDPETEGSGSAEVDTGNVPTPSEEGRRYPSCAAAAVRHARDPPDEELDKTVRSPPSRAVHTALTIEITTVDGLLQAFQDAVQGRVPTLSVDAKQAWSNGKTLHAEAKSRRDAGDTGPRT